MSDKIVVPVEQGKLSWWGRFIAQRQHKKMQRQIKMAKKYLQGLDMTLKALNMSKQKRKQFWRDFTRNDQMREGFFNA